MTWSGIVVGAIAGFAWLAIIQTLLQSGAIAASTETANWLTFGGLAAVWLAVMALVKRSGGGSGR